jgi:TolB protein
VLRAAVAVGAVAAAILATTDGGKTGVRATGRLAVVQGGDDSRLVLMHPDGSGRRTLVGRQFGLRAPAWRPDGRALAFVSSRGGAPGIWTVNVDGTGLRPLIVRGGTGKGDPAFSRDGRYIAYTRSFRGTDLLVARRDGSNPRNLVRNGHENVEPSWSPEGRRIAFVRDTPSMDVHIAVVSVLTGRVRRLTRAGEWASSPAWAPNGRSIAFVRMPQNSDVGGLAIMRPDGSGPRNLAPHLRDVVALAWSPDGRELVFTRKIAPDSEIFRLRLSDGAVRKVTRNSISDHDPAWGPPRRR